MDTLENFTGAVNTSFDLQLGVASLTMTLVEARPLPMSSFAGMLRAPFSLLFRSQSAVVLPQRIYRLQNAVIGVRELFLVPVARDRSGIVYQAVFN